MGNANVVSQGEEGQCQTFSRKKVEISNDCWLDVLKFLSCAKWSEKQYVSRQINGIASRNFSRLPRSTIEKAILNEECSKPQLLRELPDIDYAIVSFDAIIPQSETEQWFVNRGITLESGVQFHSFSTQMPPGPILIVKALFGKYSDITDMCILGPAQVNEEVHKSWFGQLFYKQKSSLDSVVFYSQFRPANKFSCASLERFLTFLFHPASYVKVVEMFAVNQKFVDAVKGKFADNFPSLGNAMHSHKSNDNKPPYIHCETFSLLYTRGMDVDGLRSIFSWLVRNVRADAIRMPFVSAYTHRQDEDTVCHLLNNFVFRALGMCAKRELRIHSDIDFNMNKLFFSLVKKFWTLPQIESEIPTIVIEPFSYFPFLEIKWALRSNVIHEGEMNSQGAEFLYVIENGHNRMRILFCERPSCRLPYHWAKEYHCYVKFYAT
ncbi:hypothetical protein Ddc_13633 [Ditylenchus destructor]|nr:hypothetical protein Ddc_13633 [Ditylenchus destructor]